MAAKRVGGWTIAESRNEIPDKRWRKIQKQCPVPEDEDVVWATWASGLLTQRVLLVTNVRVVSIWDRTVEQNLLEQLSGVEKPSSTSVVIASAGNRSTVLQKAPARLAQRAFAVLSHTWNSTRAQRPIRPLPPEPGPNVLKFVAGAATLVLFATCVYSGATKQTQTATTPTVAEPLAPAPIPHEVISEWDIRLSSGATGKGYRVFVEPKTTKKQAMALGEWFRTNSSDRVLNVEIYNSRRVVERRTKSLDVPIELLKERWLVQVTQTGVRWKPAQ